MGNSFVAFEFSESFFMDMKIKRLTVLSVLNAYMCDNIIWIYFQEWLLIRKCEKESVMQGMKNVTANSNTLLIIGSHDQLF